MMVTNQPVVHPAKTAGDLTQPIGSQETFNDHNQNRVFYYVALEAAAPECCNPVLSAGGPSPELRQITVFDGNFCRINGGRALDLRVATDWGPIWIAAR
jgi:hypothetical protein